MSGLPDRICDAHHHLWNLPSSTYVPDDLRRDIATVDTGDTVGTVVATVFVECDAWYRATGPDHLRSVGETEWVVANADPITQAIVGATDLRLGRLTEEALHAHIDAGAGRFRGIRQRATWDASPLIKPARPDPGAHLLADPRFREGVGALGRLGLSFDAWLYFPQLPELADLARAFPDITFVLNHFGGPIVLGPYADRSEVLAQWRALMVDVARCANVVVKLGGIGMPLYGMGWHKQPAPPDATEVAGTWREPIRFCIDTFGVDRCMFESNFPVDRFSMDYRTIWDAFDLATADMSASERNFLFHDTAAATYRLQTEGTT